MTTYRLKYSRFFKYISDPACILAKSGHILKANPAFCQQLKANPAQLEKQPFSNLLTAESQKAINRILDSKTEDEKTALLNLKVNTGESSAFSCSIFFDREYDQFYLTANRLTAKAKSISDQLRMYQNIILNNWDAIIFSDLSGQIALANKAALKLYGYSETEMLGRNIDIFSAQDDNHGSEIVQSLKNFGSYSGEIFHKRKDQSPFLCKLHMSMIYDENSHPVGIVASCKDISHERAAEKALAEAGQKDKSLQELRQSIEFSNERLRIFENIITNNWDAIIFSDLAGKIIITNRAAQRMYGFTAGELENQNIDVFNTDTADHGSAMVAALKEDGGWSGEIVQQRKDGTAFDVLLTVTMVYDQNGHPMGLVSTSKDISDRVQAEREAKEKNDELIAVKDRFVEDLEAQVEKRTEQLFEEKEKADSLLLNILPKETAQELKKTGSAKPRFYGSASVLFTDFAGFTRIASDFEPAELIEELHHFFTEFDAITEKHNLEKIKTIGDAYMCAGGIPTPNQTHAVDTVRAAIEIVHHIEKINQVKTAEGKEPWNLRVGIHTGSIVAGVVGKNKFAYDIWGDAVNIASRIESTGEPGKINISADTYQLVKDQFQCEPRGQIDIKNRGSIEMYFVTGPKAG